MTAENDDKAQDAPPPRRFNAAEAREKAQRKAEFILSRAYGLLRDPKGEWEQIRAEETDIPSILIGYVAPLAAIIPICTFIGSYAFGVADVRPPVDDALISAVVTFFAMIALVFLMGLMISAVAENFDGDRNELAAQKVAAYSMTPFLLSGVAWLWPPLAWLSIVAVGLTVFLLYRGLPALMKAPEERAMAYTASIAIAGLVAFIILFGVSGCVTSGGL